MKYRKTIANIALLTLLFGSTPLSAKITKSNEIKKTFDTEKGWWWYEEEIKDEDNKTKTIKYKVSPESKRTIEAQTKTRKLLQTMIEQQVISNQLNQDIKDRLDYAFPNTVPKYTINKKTGKKCISNSSMDCFVMPVIAEGQQVPVLKKFLRNPTPENSKKWLQWQATYFNHVSNVSHGLHFAFLKGGAEAYPTSTTYAYGDSLFNPKSEDLKVIRERETVLSMKKEIAYLLFLGESKTLEASSDVFTDMETLNRGYMKEMNKALIFSSKEKLEIMEKYAESVLKKDLTKQSVYMAWKSLKKVVKPGLFKKYQINITPSAVAYIKNEKMEDAVYQVISVGDITRGRLRKNTIEFMKYSGILNEVDFTADKNWNVLEKESNFLKKTLKLPKGNAPTNLKNKNTGVENEKTN